MAGVLGAGLEQVLRLPPGELRLVAAGRTDSGVHATGQVAHVDLPGSAWLAVPGRSSLGSADSLLRRLAGVLPSDLRVQRVAAAPVGFDARFSALRRHYAYRICDDPAGVPPLRRRDVLGHRPPGAGRLEAAVLNAASSQLLGAHDFAAFCRRREGATTVRTLLQYSWSRDAVGLLVARVVAEAFCHSMVRALVGAVLEVGDGRHPTGWPALLLAEPRRSGAFSVAPALGLTLEQVDYPPAADLAVRAEAAKARRSLL